MKRALIFLCVFFLGEGAAPAQELPLHLQQQLENESVAGNAVEDDDGWQQELDYYRSHPLPVNTASAEEFRQLGLLSDMQVQQLLRYRELFGHFLHVAELQAVPGLDPGLVRQLLPLVTTDYRRSINEIWQERKGDGAHEWLYRMSGTLERAAGYRGAVRAYPGGPLRLLLRYRYQYKKNMYWGWLGEKDAGESFFGPAQPAGFDFHSAHFFVRRVNFVQALALGDFTVNLGQGLVHWQGLAFRKGAEATAIRRQSPVLQPYRAAGEYAFLRGAGLTLGKGRWSLTGFVSDRRLSANLAPDTVNDRLVMTSLQTSGLHRTKAELEDRGRVRLLVTGMGLRYQGTRWQAGLHAVRDLFSVPWQKRDEPYNRYAIAGRDWYNAAMDYCYTRRNLHVFGEAALSKQGGHAWVQGLLLSLDPRADLAVFYRKIGPAYQAVSGSAFTEGTMPTNESGLYTGITIRPFAGVVVQAYADIYRFPWLRYGVDAPSRGRDYQLLGQYRPGKRAELVIRYRLERKEENLAGTTAPVHQLAEVSRRSLRAHFAAKAGNDWLFRERAEWVDRRAGTGTREQGFLGFFEAIYRPMLGRFGGGIRVQYFETEGYDSRIYAYEQDVDYSYSIPSFYDLGWRYYLNFNADWGEKWTFWARFAQTVYPGKESIGAGPDKISGKKRSEWRFQARFRLH